MKKSLLAVAAMTAFAGAAQAQSSVTVYGILDVGFSGLATRGADSTIVSGTPTTNAINNTKIQQNEIGSGYLATSRLGFKGTEDLGGGTSAFFTVEIGLSPTETSASVSGTTNFNNRQSFVGLGKKGLGQAAVGTQYTPVFNAMTATNPGANNTVVGSIVYPASSTQGTTTVSMTTRLNNAVTVQSDSFAGFRANAMYNVDNQNNTQTSATAGGTDNTSGYGIGVDYTWKKLYATVAFQSLKNETTGTTNTVAANSTDNQTFAGATYDFGVLKAYAQWVNRKATSALNSNQYLSRSGQQIGVRSNITPAIVAWANIGTGKYQSFGNGEPTANFNAWQLGSQYNLSKRTSLYAIYGQTQTSSTTSAAGVTGSAAASQYAIGARHTF